MKSNCTTAGLVAVIALVTVSVPILADSPETSREQLSLSRISSVILRHRDLKVRPEGMSAEEHEQMLLKRGLNPQNLETEQCTLYFKNKLTDQGIADLSEKGIKVKPSAWIRAVPGSHPFSYYLTTVRYDSPRHVQNDPRMVRLVSVESRTHPHTDVAGAIRLFKRWQLATSRRPGTTILRVL